MAAAVKTLQTVFPNTYAWDVKQIDIILVALKSGRSIDPAKAEARVGALDKDVYGLSFGADPADLAAAVGATSIPINTDDHPLIEFAATRNKISGIKKTGF